MLQEMNAMEIKEIELARRPEELTDKYLSLLHEKRQLETELESLTRELLSRYEEVNVFYDLSEDLASTFEQHEILNAILQKSYDVLDARAAWIFLSDDSSKHLKLSASLLKGLKLELGVQEDISKLCAQSYDSGQNFLIESYKDLETLMEKIDPDSRPKSHSQWSALVYPLWVRKVKLGSMAVLRGPDQPPFTSESGKLMAAICALAAVALYNKQLAEELRREELARRELEIASAIQQNLLPSETPQLPGIQISSHYIAANKVGGDYLDYLVDPRGNLVLVIADVSGHNIGAAILMAGTRGVIRSSLQKQSNPAAILKETNRVMYKDLDRSDLFLSAVVACFNPCTRVINLANAGHNPPLVWRARSQMAEWIYSQSFFIGLEPSLELTHQSISLEPGDVFLLYTDGLIEAANPAGERFENDRLANVVGRFASEPASEIVRQISLEVIRFMQRDTFEDDISFLALKLTS
ncbi:MAG: GAF domain-containing protein [Calditrichaeota bacterium]|nr:MAG: GAF domain-containing protein [Calditrichota bacterium]